jgi:TRAP-type C4-dicarboxylate transport system permease small subunit
MGHPIFRLEDRLYFVEKWICALSLLVMLIAVSFGVCIRFFTLPIPNVGEWAVVAMSPLTFVGAAMCSRMGQHISVDFIDQARSPLVRRLAHIIVALLMVVFASIYAWLGWILLQDVIFTGERLLDMGTPLYVPIFFLFLGMVLMIVHSAFELARSIGKLLPLTSSQG